MNTNAGDLRLVGGHVALDFVNTVANHRAATLKEYLPNYSEFVRWLAHVGLYDAVFTEQLMQAALQRPDDAQRILQQVLGLRGALFVLCSRDVGGEQALAQVNGLLQQAPRRDALRFADGGFEWDRLQTDVLEEPLWDLLGLAVDLLTSPQYAHVGVCAGDGCSWVFLDTSRKKNRRWCSMLDCGNRAKAKRHYARLATADA